MLDFEKLGAFYLGRGFDLQTQESRKDLLLYDAKDLTTHAIVVGMTGSGKTGLSVVLLEEAAIDGIPALIIDPKGDMGNLLLSFPNLRPEDFRPWIDESDAARSGVTPEAYAAGTAETWAQGLEAWGQNKERISRFRQSAQMSIYTPGSEAGLSLNLLESFAAPPVALARDPDALRERTLTAVSSLLGLIGVDADPIRSREHILVSNILSRTWAEGGDTDIAGLIGTIQSPPFDKLGVMDLESFFPSKDRHVLAMQLNNLLASEAFSAWAKGDPLDIQSLFYTPEGKPRLSIFSIAHLSDAERMFFVTLLLNEVVAWMRTLSGTGSLRAILYMDEIFGYFPPSAEPPSKTPMLTLLKQGRAYGLGVVLATQNPVDLDYKGLANTGTWFLGRLQTARDKERVLSGLEGASAGRDFDKKDMDRLLSSLDKRVFLMHNVHEDEPTVFKTRWALSYLRGPLLRNQVATLMAPRKTHPDAARPSEKHETLETTEKPVLPSDIREVYLPVDPAWPQQRIVYRPALLGHARLHYVSARGQVDHWEEIATLVPLAGADMNVDWERGARWEGDPAGLEEEAAAGAAHAELPAAAMRPDSYMKWSKSYANFLYRAHGLQLWESRSLRQTSRPGETESDFRIRLSQRLRERRDLELEKLRKKYAPKLAKLQQRIDKAEERVFREKSQYDHQKLETAISFGASILGALTGRKLGSARNVGRATTAARSASRAARERDDIDHAKKQVQRLRERLSEMQETFEVEAVRIRELSLPTELEEISVRPRKADISVIAMVLAWTPAVREADGL